MNEARDQTITSLSSLKRACGSAQTVLERARDTLAKTLAPKGKIDTEKLEQEQRAAHGLAWLATLTEALKQTQAHAERLDRAGTLLELDALLTQIAAAELLAEIAGGLQMGPGETVRLAELGIGDAATQFTADRDVVAIVARNTPQTRKRLLALISAQDNTSIYGASGLDATLEEMRAQMRRFVEAEIAPRAQDWHLANALIPDSVLKQMAELGVFALTVPERYGGLALGKESMCVVSEELTRGWIGVGSMGTRAEIAAELILNAGTQAQKQKYLPRLASGETLPTAVFTEPDVGSDLANIKTRAVREGDIWRITGQKTWITHGARADLMTLLARTGAPGHGGLSLFLAEKPRGQDRDPFPAKGMQGSEIEVLGYRGMREYEISFDGFEVPADALLGGQGGEGFAQLMSCFEAARIQTAARGLGLAQSALELALSYARARRQFGKSIVEFPRVSDKIAALGGALHAARQLTYASARAKDKGRRADLEAGMAKLLSARVAWACADACVQIHGGNGFALEFPASRLLCDARILSIFEGASEIQAGVIARRLLGG